MDSGPGGHPRTQIFQLCEGMSALHLPMSSDAAVSFTCVLTGRRNGRAPLLQSAWGLHRKEAAQRAALTRVRLRKRLEPWPALPFTLFQGTHQ